MTTNCPGRAESRPSQASPGRGRPRPSGASPALSPSFTAPWAERSPPAPRDAPLRRRLPQPGRRRSARGRGPGEGRQEARAERRGEGHPQPLTWQPFLWWKPTTTMCSTGPRFSMEQPGDGRAGGCRRARALAPPPGVRRGRSPGRLRFRTARPGRAGTALSAALRPTLPELRVSWGGKGFCDGQVPVLQMSGGPEGGLVQFSQVGEG